jgi:Holliday junction resolvase-like predicted endonuclease
MTAASRRLARRGLLGALSEHLAALVLRCHGHAIVARRANIAGVEVDLLTRKGDGLALVEVKARGPRGAWLPSDQAVSAAQRQRLLRAAAALAPSQGGPVRVHLVLVRWTPLPRLTVHWDAFAG